jgi:hypothetical protein
MLSGRLIHLIESREEELAARIVRSIRSHPELTHLGALPEPEMRDRIRQILKNLGHWLAHENEQKLAREYENVGRERFEEAIPLEEAVRGLCLIKDKMIDFVDEQGVDHTYLALYDEEQLERRVGWFFDTLTVHLVRGYEAARRRAARAVA